MTERRAEESFFNSDWRSIPGLQRFYHQAMATTFEVIIVEEDASYAGQPALLSMRLTVSKPNLAAFSKIAMFRALTISLPIGLCSWAYLPLSVCRLAPGCVPKQTGLLMLLLGRC
jgi:hypothetical protein